jgi:hypothetical protein
MTSPPLHIVDQRQYRALEFFAVRTSLELAGFFSPELWQQDVVRMSLSTPALRHGIAALASIHEGYAIANKHSGRELQRNYYEYALQQHSMSISSLRETVTSTSNIEAVIISCALLVCLDSWRGKHASALMHLKAGIQIFAEHHAKKARKTLTLLERRIIYLYANLGIQAGLFVDTHLPDDLVAIWMSLSTLSADIDVTVINTIDDARHILNISITKFMLYYSRFTSSTPHTVKSYRTAITQDLAIWNRVFDKMIFKRTPETLTSNELRATLLLKLHSAAVGIAISPPEADMYSLTPQFETIISLTRSLISKTTSTSGISTDLGLVPPLYVTISRCPLPHIRKEGLSLLQTMRRREGMWDSAISAKIAEQIISVDEEEVMIGVENLHSGLHDLGIVNSEILHVRILNEADSEEGLLDDNVVIGIAFEKKDRSTGESVVTTRTVSGAGGLF